MPETECPVEAVLPSGRIPCRLPRGHEPGHDFNPYPVSADPAALLEQWRRAEQKATKGPWSVSRRHGTDIADEAWSEVKITAPDGSDIAATYISHLLENYTDGDDADFIVTARTAMPLLAAALEAVLKLTEPPELRDYDLDGNWEGPVEIVIRAALIRETVTRELTGKGGRDG